MLRRWIEGASARLPSQCAVCRAWPSRRLCDGCVARFAQPVARCRTCAIRVEGGASTCGDCLRQRPPLDGCVAAIDYGYPWADLIGRFKFHDDTGWAQPLATLLRSTPWVEPALEAARWVLPMPLAPARLQERGYNQAALLARGLATGKLDSRLLLRIRDTPAQHGLTRAERLRNLQGAFAVDPLRAHVLHGAAVVLVDDVMTTGASLWAAAAALRQAGAARVVAVVLARTPAP